MATPTIVLVPGAWHTAEAFDRVAAKLRADGYSVESITLPSVGGEAGVAEDAAFIRMLTSRLADDGRDIVLVSHSYAGMPVIESVVGLSKKNRETERKQGGIVALVHIAANLAEPGVSLLDQMALPIGRYALPATLRLEGTQIRHLAAINKFYNDLPLSEALVWESNLKTQSLASFSTSTTSTAYKQIPATYIVCENDNAAPVDMQIAMARSGGDNVKIVRSTAAHCPMLSMPDTVVRVIENACSPSPYLGSLSV